MFEKILHRPALAIVISLIILFLGGLGILSLPMSQFPSIAPPSVAVMIAYPGASAEVLTNSVLIPMEQAINGVVNMRYMISDATSAGEATIQVYFEPGTNPGQAVVNVQNRISLVKNRLPPLVQREGILVSQLVPSMLMYVNVFSTQKDVDEKFLYNFTNVNILPEIQRVQGVGRAKILGTRQYAMRIWLHPDRMRAYSISSEDVMEALADQSVIGTPGRLGRASGYKSQAIEYVLTYEGRYNKPEQYEDIILRATPDGEILRLGDVARVELGSEFYDIYTNINGHPAAAVVLKQSPGSNAPVVIREVKALLEEIKRTSFEPGMDYSITYDVSSFLDASIEKVVHTLFEAFILVSLVVFLFLGDARSTLIPTLAVPVSLIGTFFFMNLFGLSINLITLFALVLAIGIVVDDAIVVVEAVHATMEKHKLGPYRATMQVLREISGAIIAITLVMTAVFVPVTFMTGPVGTFYRQFAMTMASAIVLSAVVALTLTPVLCAMILEHSDPSQKSRGRIARLLAPLDRLLDKAAGRSANAIRMLMGLVVGIVTSMVVFQLLTAGPVHDTVGMILELNVIIRSVLAGIAAMPAMALVSSIFPGSDPANPNRGPLGAFLVGFNTAVESVADLYAWIVNRIVTQRILTLLVVAGFMAGLYFVSQRLRTGFIPNEDQGMIYAIIQTPAGSTLEYTNSRAVELQKICEDIEEVASVTAMAGYEVLTEGRGSNAGTCMINLKNWSDRERTSFEVVDELEKKCSKMTDTKVEFFQPPAVPGFGAAGGFAMRLLDRTNSSDYQTLGKVNDQFLAALGKRKELSGLFTFFIADYPQFELIINNELAMQKSVTIRDALDNLSIMIGSTYEQGFILFGRFFKVYVQAAPEYRRLPDDLMDMFVKNDEGEMVPYSSFMSLVKRQGMNEYTRYNMYPSSAIQGKPASGFSSGEALQAIQEVADQSLPRGYDIGWQGLAYDQVREGNRAIYVLIVVAVFVYLVLVAQYESFLLPAAVIVSLPVGLFGAFLFLKKMGLANDVYAQIGVIMLVGLLGKNAILIVEFAVQSRNEGLSLRESAVRGARARFRPIIMTSFAFIAGLLPMVFATGPGAIGNRTIGTASVGGMLGGTLLGIFVIPGLYYIFAKLSDGRHLIRDGQDERQSELSG